MVTYNYTFTGDVDKLGKALSYVLGENYVQVKSVGNALELTVDDSLANDDIDLVNDLIIDPLVLENTYDSKKIKLFRYIKERKIPDLTKPLFEHNYKVGLNVRLEVVEELVFGRLLKSILYPMNYDTLEIDLNDPILEVQFDYSLDDINMVSSRVKKVFYYREDGTISDDVRVMPKLYKNHAPGDESQVRRQNIINELKANVQNMLVGGGLTANDSYAASEAFMASIQTDVDAYVQRANNTILTSITNHTIEFLDAEVLPGVTARAYVLSKLDYWTYELGGGQYKGSLL